MTGRILALSVCLGLSPALAIAQTPQELAETARFIAHFQNPDGGFAGSVGGKSALGSTSSAIRSLRFVGGSIPDVPGCIRYVLSCADKDSGGFAPTPGGKPDVATTASGLMALGELKIGDEETISKALDFIAANAKTFEELRIGVAGFEAVGKASPVFSKWTEQVQADRRPDGTWGDGGGRSFATGSAAVALLRMGVKLDKKDAVLAALRDGQLADGGWSKEGTTSDFPTTYRVMRCFFMLGEKPDLEKLRRFVARHRQSDGGYSAAVGSPADLGGTYFASIVLYWGRLLDGEPALIETAGFVPLFNGKDTTGWEGDATLWAARDGMLVGKSPGIKQNQFLATEKSYQDFILQYEFRLVDGAGNSGVQFRSVRVPGTEMSGYQADIGEKYWGCLYDESRRNKVLVQAAPDALAAVHESGWNHEVVRAMGDRIRLTLNGKTAVDYKEEDPGIARDGKIAVQIHSGGPMEIQFKNVLIQPLPIPKADNDSTPGFHLRGLKTSKGERKYAVFLPEGYDGKKPFPVVLFLHGSGERGEDGIASAQVGLGPIIAGQPSAFPAIAIFPQARQTWAAKSDDAEAAIEVLDEVLKTERVDRDRVVLTGLSMGGAGAWQMAASYPEKFSAVVPICGPGKAEDVPVLKDLPIWSVVGDADRAATVTNLRTMNEALRSAGASPRITEYRGVGHNSWDRAYSDPKILDWMLAQARKPRL